MLVQFWPRAKIKYEIIFDFDKTYKAQKEKRKFLKIYKNFSPNSADVFVIAGGDGLC